MAVLAGFCLAVVTCGKEAPRAPSSATNVVVLEHEFSIPELNRPRKLRVYLPPDYATSERRYPVLYMHDAQNLFDDATSYAGEWGVDETLNELFDKQGFALIVVGVDNGGEKRMNELSPWPNQDFGAAEGRQYMDFLVDDVKAYVDEHYRTLPDQEHTAIMGSSMGGREGWDSVADMAKMTAQLLGDEWPADRLESRVVPQGEHNECFWRASFAAAVTWLYEVPVSEPSAYPDC